MGFIPLPELLTEPVVPSPLEPLLAVTFRYEGSDNVYQSLINILAGSVANAPGLIWKIWLVNEAEAEAGGLYLFSTREALQSYLQVPALGAIRHRAGVTDFSVKTFDTLNKIPLGVFRRLKQPERAEGTGEQL